MAKRAFIIGGTGQIGRAACAALMDRGWAVALASRGRRWTEDGTFDGVDHIELDLPHGRSLASALGGGADLLLDTIGYDDAAAERLLAVQADVAHIAVVSSASVYRDDAGRTLDEARAQGFPEFSEPITERQPTVDPSPATYSTRKVAMERLLLDGARTPVTILRPCAIHGPYSQHPREWWLVKRLLDRRARIPLAYEGRSRFHTTSTASIAALIATVAERTTTQVLNVVDADAPSVAEIGRAVMSVLGRSAEFVPVPDEGYPPRMGVSPWSVPRPFVLSDGAARATGYAPVGTYAETVGAAVRWLAAGAAGRDWRSAFPQLAAYPFDLFDYAAEDAWLDGVRS